MKRAPRTGSAGALSRRLPMTGPRRPAAGFPMRDVEVPPEVRRLVLDRDGWRCVRCSALVTGGGEFGVILRRDDGDVTAENLMTACDQCRRCIGLRQDLGDQRRGLWLWPSQDPAVTPVRWHGSGRPGWLLPDGGISYEDPAGSTS